MEAGEVPCWSWGELEGCFHLFRLRPTWAPLFAFARDFTAEKLGVDGTGSRWLGAVTVPMSWKNAVGVFQFAHREIVRFGRCRDMGTQKIERPPLQDPGAIALSTLRETRKRATFFPTLSRHKELCHLWEVYVDEFDGPKVLRRNRNTKHLRPKSVLSSRKPVQDTKYGAPLGPKTKRALGSCRQSVLAP